MQKEIICEKVRELCSKENIDFLFITEGKSCWSISHDEHIRKVAKFHKENEPKHKGAIEQSRCGVCREWV